LKTFEEGGRRKLRLLPLEAAMVVEEEEMMILI